ncbi:MAG: ATP synthase subunit I [Gammaproteobacteria bacterium]|nr:ATP synthase subunit I [Gammaproteobacteria bacterium]MBU1415972.1 ATP synthase subunit I [Gammaproteobacteria bacterium]
MASHLEGFGRVVAWRFRPFLVTMVWQLIATVALALVAGAVAGRHGALSALLGGSIGLVGVLVFALFSRPWLGGAPSNVIGVALRAEAAKILVIVVMLWLAFAVYHDMVVLAFLGAFMVSVLLSGLAFAASGNRVNSSRI